MRSEEYLKTSQNNCPQYLPQYLIIKLPPEGLLIRELVITGLNFINYYARYRGYKIEIKKIENGYIVCSSDLERILREVSNAVVSLIELKEDNYIRWPSLHQNDKGTLKKSGIVGSIINKLETYGELAKNYVENLHKLMNTKFDVRIGNKEIILSTGGNLFAMPQLFKIEFYENALTYQKPYRKDLDIRLDDHWLMMILLGYSISHMKYAGAVSELMTTHEFSEAHEFIFYLLINVAGLLEKLATEPSIINILQVHILLRKLMIDKYWSSLSGQYPYLRTLSGEKSLVESRELLKTLVGSVFPKMRIHRISYYGKTFTEISREDVLINDMFLDFLLKIKDDECIDWLFQLSKIASYANDPKILNVLVYLYEAINKAKDPAFVSYYMARTILEDERYDGYRASRCMKSVIKGLTGIELHDKNKAK